MTQAFCILQQRAFKLLNKHVHVWKSEVSKVKPKFEIYIYIKLTVCDLTAIHWWLNKLQQIYDYKVRMW